MPDGSGMGLLAIEWGNLLRLDVPFLEIFVRGTVIYLTLFLLLRFVLKRQSGTVGIGDLLVVVLIADASQNAMAGEYRSIPDGILLVATIIFWSYALDWLGYRFPRLRRILYPPPLPLVKDGVLNPRNMRKELITEEELLSQLRQQGVERIEDVKLAFMEGDGRISAIPRGGRRGGAREQRRAT